MTQWGFVEWLLLWILETSYFESEWDRKNISKNKIKHDIGIDEIEEVFRSDSPFPWESKSLQK